MRPIHRRYLSTEWEQERIGLSDHEVEAKTRERFEAAVIAGVTIAQVRRLRLDDPFQSAKSFEQQLWLAARKKAAQ